MSAYPNTNIVLLPATRRRRTEATPDPVGVLADLAARVAEIGLMPLESRRDMLEALVLLDQSNLRARRLIGEIEDEQGRSRLLDHSERISELIKIARRKAVAI